MQKRAVQPVSSKMRSRREESAPPPGTVSAPRRETASNADQKPMNGANEKAKKARSAPVTPQASSTLAQQQSHHSQLSAVSRMRSGAPVVPEVWW